MKGGTLVASKRTNFHSRFKMRLEQLGFSDVTITSAEKDGLDMMIREAKPKLLIIGSSFYECCSPFIIAGLHERFPKLNIASISLTDYPKELAMSFIVNGVKSYVNYWDGHEEFYKALETIKNGNEYIPNDLKKRLINFNGCLKTNGYVTDRQVEIMRLICNGWQGSEIGNVLQICKNTVDNSKTAIYKALGVRNEKEMIIKALKLKFFSLDEILFYPPNYEFLSLPNKTIGERK